MRIFFNFTISHFLQFKSKQQVSILFSNKQVLFLIWWFANINQTSNFNKCKFYIGNGIEMGT